MPTRRLTPRKSKPGGTAQMIGDVCDHLQDLRRYYFDVVSADEDEVTVRVRRQPPQRPVGFRRDT
jgi:hypothetical protein